MNWLNSKELRGLPDRARQRGNQPSSQYNQSPFVNLCSFLKLFSFTSLTPVPTCLPSTTPKLRFPSKFPLLWLPSCILHRSPSRPLPPSDEGQDAVDEQGHDGGAEQASHRHRDEPGQEDVPEEVPVHGFLGADPAHGYDRAHLDGADGEKRQKNNQQQNWTRLKVAEMVKSCRVSLRFSGLCGQNIFTSNRHHCHFSAQIYSCEKIYWHLR